MKLVVSAGDPSGDIRAGEVFRELSGITDLQVSGLGGRNIASAGGEIYFDLRDYSVMGFTEVLSSLGKFRRLRRSMKSHILSESPDMLFLVDYPGFNIPLALWARKKGFRVIYYISPQLWAWGKRRIRKIAGSVDLMITLFDFEVEFYRKHKIRAVCAGHPLIDSIPEPFSSRPGGELALLPGSRAQEVELLLGPMLETFTMLRDRGDINSAAVSRSASVPDTLYEQALRTEGVHLEDSIEDSLRHASAAVVCSGTATLDTALWGVPMVITYRTSPFTFFLARILVRGIDRIGMANIVVPHNHDIAPELIQNDVSPRRIMSLIRPYLEDTEERELALSGLASVRVALGEPGASSRVAELLLQECDE